MNDVTALEQQLSDAKKLVEQRQLALKLSRNRDFRKLILEEFCEKECARYAQNSSSPALSAEERADCLGIAQAAGHLKRWLSVQVQMGAHAERDMPNIEEALVEARLEEDVEESIDDNSDEDGDEQ